MHLQLAQSHDGFHQPFGRYRGRPGSIRGDLGHPAMLNGQLREGSRGRPNILSPMMLR